MAKPIDSVGWTGPLVDEAMVRGGFTHRAGEPAVTSDYARILAAQPKPGTIPPELRGLVWLIALLIASPLMLLCAWLLLHSVIRDQFIADNRLWLIAWGCTVVALGLLQLRWRSTAAIFVRKAMLTVGVLASAAFSVGYVHLGVSSYAYATVSGPERTFELARSCGRRCVETVHQRADGSTVEGTAAGPPVPYATTCTRVQRIDGNHGFSWVRVLERSRPAGKVFWPIRREACFGDQPISSLHG